MEAVSSFATDVHSYVRADIALADAAVGGAVYAWLYNKACPPSIEVGSAYFVVRSPRKQNGAIVSVALRHLCSHALAVAVVLFTGQSPA